MKWYEDKRMILADDVAFDLDCHKTQLNNNVLVVGTAGAGKTRSIVSPNILQASGSYVISDPKGNLYDKYGDYLRERGYQVKKLDFTNTRESCHYNIFHYIESFEDVSAVAYTLVYNNEAEMREHGGDPFWNQAACMLLRALIGYQVEFMDRKAWNLKTTWDLAKRCLMGENNADDKNDLDRIFEDAAVMNPDSNAVREYYRFRIGAARTQRSVLISVGAILGGLDTPELQYMMQSDDMELEKIGQEKTAVFVVVSDTERSKDQIANIFFTQAMQALCRYADRYCLEQALPVPVRFILDDFATNVKITEFPRMIASCRSRNISAMLMVQTESQLEQGYGQDARTIIGNCDTYIYLGANDGETAKHIAERSNVPLEKILYMPVGSNWIFRRGQKPINGRNFVLENYEEFHKAAEAEHAKAKDQANVAETEITRTA